MSSGETGDGRPTFSITDLAEEDLNEIVDFLETQSRKNAAAFIGHFLSACEALAEMQGMGHRRGTCPTSCGRAQSTPS